MNYQKNNKVRVACNSPLLLSSPIRCHWLACSLAWLIEWLINWLIDWLIVVRSFDVCTVYQRNQHQQIQYQSLTPYWLLREIVCLRVYVCVWLCDRLGQTQWLVIDDRFNLMVGLIADRLIALRHKHRRCPALFLFTQREWWCISRGR